MSKEITKFLTDRKINELPFTVDDFQANVVEELLELQGFDVPKENRYALRQAFTDFAEMLYFTKVISKKKIHSARDVIDAITDIRVFCLDGTLKLEYDADKTLHEVAKEISSRQGEIIDGKFEKDANQDPSTLYKADFTGCKLEKEVEE